MRAFAYVWLKCWQFLYENMNEYLFTELEILGFFPYRLDITITVDWEIKQYTKQMLFLTFDWKK